MSALRRPLPLVLAALALTCHAAPRFELPLEEEMDARQMRFFEED